MIEKTAPRIEYSAFFNMQLEAAPLMVKIAFKETLEIFLEDPNHPQLRNHALSKDLSQYRSIDVTLDWRAIFTETKTGTRVVIRFHMLGTHSQLYGE